jgi:hypothetical protein
MTETDCIDLSPRARRAQGIWLAALFGWALAFVGASKLVGPQSLPRGATAWLAAAVASAAAFGSVLAYRHFLTTVDELHQLVERTALGRTVAVGFVAWTAASILERGGAPGLDWSDVPVLAMSATYSLSVVLGRWRYR